MGLRDWPEPFFDLGSTGQWNDLDVSTTLVYVVEFDGTSDLRVAIEEPSAGGMHSGIGMIRGWAVSSDPIERVEVFDRYTTSPTVASAFSPTVNFNGLDNESHLITVTDWRWVELRDWRRRLCRTGLGYFGAGVSPGQWNDLDIRNKALVTRALTIGRTRIR